MLDLGCGTGIWCTEFAASHPSSNVLGVDVLTPSERLVPERDLHPGCTFVKANFEDEWHFAKGRAPFDYINLRMLLVGVKDWRRLFHRCNIHLRGGAYLESLEGEFKLCSARDPAMGSTESPAMRWFDLAKEYMSDHGMKWDQAAELPRLLYETGFKIVEDTPLKMTLYPDPNDPESVRNRIAEIQLDDVEALVDNMSQRLFGHNESLITQEEGLMLKEQAKQDLRENGPKARYYIHL